MNLERVNFEVYIHPTKCKFQVINLQNYFALQSLVAENKDFSQNMTYKTCLLFPMLSMVLEFSLSWLSLFHFDVICMLGFST